MAIRVACHRARESSSQLDHSKTQKPTHLSSACQLDTESLRPSRTLFEHSNPVSAAVEFGLYDSSVPKTRHASGPRTGVRDRLRFLRAWCDSVAASPLGELAPTLRAPALFDRCVAPTIAELRRPPADKLVKSEIAATLTVEGRPRNRTLSRILQNYLPRA